MGDRQDEVLEGGMDITMHGWHRLVYCALAAERAWVGMRKFWMAPAIILVVFFLARPHPAGTPGLLATQGAEPIAAQGLAVPGIIESADNTLAEAIGILDDVAPPAEPTPQPTASPTPAPTITPTTRPEREQRINRAVPTVELAALEPQTAPPTPAPSPSPQPELSPPSRLIIPAVGLDLVPIPVGVDANRIAIVPRHDAGWYTSSARPGEGSNIVFWGHVLRWLDTPNVPAPFARLHELPLGAALIVVTADGAEHRYQITQQVKVRPEQVEYVYPTMSERVTLVSCIGNNVIRDGTLTKEFRLITIAEPLD
jgi:LPXTG-site transpeptidase (sortase) family protein